MSARLMADRDALLLPLSPAWGEGTGVRGEIDPVPASLERLLALSPLAPTCSPPSAHGITFERVVGVVELEDGGGEEEGLGSEPDILHPRRLVLRVF